MKPGALCPTFAMLAHLLCACSDPAPVCRATEDLTGHYLVPRESFQGAWTHRAELVWTEGDVGIPLGTAGPTTRIHWLEELRYSRETGAWGFLLAVREPDGEDPVLAFSASGPFEAGAWSDTGQPCTVLGDHNVAVHGDDLRVDWSRELVGTKAVLPFGSDHEVETVPLHPELAPSVERLAEQRDEVTGDLLSVSAATGYRVAPTDCPEPCDAWTRVLVRHRLSAE